jgi:membrane-associated phospholipid phosphatase
MRSTGVGPAMIGREHMNRSEIDGATMAGGACDRCLPAAKEARRLDVAIYSAVAETPTPGLDRFLSRLSRAADYSRLSIASALALSLAGGRRGRAAATMGLASVAVTSTVLNLGVKPVVRRRRPDRVAHEVPPARQVRMPSSTAFPSGHSAAAFAFATGVASVLPAAGFPLRALAALVAYSRVHTGVHYPGDVVAGALLGSALAQATTFALERHSGWAPEWLIADPGPGDIMRSG